MECRLVHLGGSEDMEEDAMGVTNSGSSTILMLLSGLSRAGVRLRLPGMVGIRGKAGKARDGMDGRSGSSMAGRSRLPSARS